MKNEYTITGESCYVTLTRERGCLIDVKDMDSLGRHRWYARKSGNGFYAATNMPDGFKKQTSITMHRAIMDPADGMVVDHISEDTLDNRRCNLRAITKRDNNLNRKPNKGSTSKYSGVHWSRNEKCWKVQINIAGHGVYLGRFNDEKEAAFAYASKFVEIWGEDANPRVTKLLKEAKLGQVSV